MTNDGRKNKRVLAALKVRYKSATVTDFISKHSHDISSGGVFIRSKKPLSKGTLLKIDFRLEDDTPVIQGVGRVVWNRTNSQDSQKPAGMGIKFIKLDSSSTENIKKIVTARNEGKEIDKSSLIPTTAGESSGVLETSTIKEDISKMDSWAAMPADKNQESASTEKQIAKAVIESDDKNKEEEVTTKVDSDEKEEATESIDDSTGNKKVVEATDKTASELNIEESDSEQKKQDSTKAEAKKEKKKKEDVRQQPIATKKNSKSLVHSWLWIAVLLGVIVFIYFSSGTKEEIVPEIEEALTPQVEQPEVEQLEEPPEPELQEDTKPPVAKTVIVTTVPEGAQVFINGESLEQLTPTRINDLPSGEEISMEARMFGHETVTMSVTPTYEDETPVILTLDKVDIVLDFISNPQGARIFIENKPRGRTPASVKQAFEDSIYYELRMNKYQVLGAHISQEDCTYEEDKYICKVDVQLVADQQAETPVRATPAPAKTGTKPEAKKEPEEQNIQEKVSLESKETTEPQDVKTTETKTSTEDDSPKTEPKPVQPKPAEEKIEESGVE